jgi:tellurite methyltransferase
VADADQERWNGRYSSQFTQRNYSWQPSGWLLEIAAQLQPPRADARALDLACGGGRNAVWLAERRWTVDAWDLSDVGLAILTREVDERAARGAPIEVYPQQIDLDAAAIPQAVYDLVLNMMFMHRQLWPSIAASLRPGGLLVYQTFVQSPALPPEVNTAYALAQDELRATFERLGLETLSYDEQGERSTARLLARKPA